METTHEHKYNYISLYKLISIYFRAVVGAIIVCIVITLYSFIIIVDFHLNNYVVISEDKIYYNKFFLTFKNRASYI